MNHRRILFALALAAAGCGGKQKKSAAPDPKLAREQALEQARNAGILGSISAGDGSAFGSLVGYGDVSSGFDDDDVYGGLVGEDYGYGGEGYGYGFNDTGYGEGGGGAGYGTIGSGDYGTLGHGGAYGQRTQVGVPVFEDGTSDGMVAMLMEGQREAYDKCVPSDLHGTVYVKLSLSAKGRASNISAEGIRGDVDRCIELVIGHIDFDPPEDGTAHTVDFQIAVE